MQPLGGVLKSEHRAYAPTVQSENCRYPKWAVDSSYSWNIHCFQIRWRSHHSAGIGIEKQLRKPSQCCNESDKYCRRLQPMTKNSTDWHLAHQTGLTQPLWPTLPPNIDWFAPIKNDIFHFNTRTNIYSGKYCMCIIFSTQQLVGGVRFLQPQHLLVMCFTPHSH